MRPRLSVVIPVYNLKKHMSLMLDSLKSQKISEKGAVEVIFVDDGSTDDSAQMLERFCAENDFAQLITQQNGGVSSARNAGLNEAIGEYVCFFDGDDYLSDDCFEKILEGMTVSQVDLIFFGYDRCDGKKRVEALYEKYGDYHADIAPENLLGAYITDFILCKRVAQMYSVVFRRDLIMDNGILFPPGKKYGEDLYFVWRALLSAKTVATLPVSLYRYVVDRQGSAMSSKSATKERRDSYDLFLRLHGEMKESKSQWTERFENLTLPRELFAVMRFIAKKKDKKLFREMMRDEKIKNEYMKLGAFPGKAIRLTAKFAKKPLVLYYIMRIKG